jgi:hypothetical protein
VLKEVKADGSGQWKAVIWGRYQQRACSIDPALENALYALKKAGEISEVVRMPSGFTCDSA